MSTEAIATTDQPPSQVEMEYSGSPLAGFGKSSGSVGATVKVPSRFESETVQLHWALHQMWLVLEETSEQHTRNALRRHREQRMPLPPDVVPDGRRM